jgi:hypothetical protein
MTDVSEVRNLCMIRAISVEVDRHFRSAYCLNHQCIHGAILHKAVTFILPAVRNSLLSVVTVDILIHSLLYCLLFRLCYAVKYQHCCVSSIFIEILLLYCVLLI